MGSDPSGLVLDGRAREVMVRVTLDRLLDELDELWRLVWGDGELDRRELRTKVTLTMTLVCAVSDGVRPLDGGELPA